LGDDGAPCTAYGDGRGFAPPAPRKLGLGLARVVGPPEDFRGLNIPSPTGERIGDGPAGKKAGGMLMVDGVLYLFIWTILPPLPRRPGTSRVSLRLDTRFSSFASTECHRC
jgi:hypothetical protein